MARKRDIDVLVLTGSGVSDQVAAMMNAVIIPDGPVRSSKGDFLLDSHGAAAIIRNFESHGVDLVVDYNHETIEKNGHAPAAGWIKRLFYRAGEGLRGMIRWCEPAEKMIAAKQFRFLSPVLLTQGGRPFQLHSVGLTNTPAISNAPEIVACCERLVLQDDGFPPDSFDGGSAGESASPNFAVYVQKLAELLDMGGDSVEDVLQRTFDTLKGAIEEATGASPNRRMLINCASSAYTLNTFTQRITSRAAFINEHLRQHGKPRLSSEEQLIFG